MDHQNNITTAEWQIMRLIWSEGETTSSHIISRLNISKNWSPTTVKTLLARLVKKGAVGFRMRGRSRDYYPLISEQDCVKNEMHNVIMRLYGGTVNYRTDHFVFYGANNQNYIKILADELEKNYTRILSILEFEMSDEIMVYTHETQQNLHSALGVSNGPKWMRAGGAWGILHIAPFECFDDIKAEKAAVHIFSQIVIYRINSKTPYWLMQGASAYLSQWMELKRLKTVINANYCYISNSIMSDISIDFETFKDKGGYELAYTMAEYIVTNYSYSHLTRFLKTPDNYVDIFNYTKEEFQAKWLEYLNDRYREGKADEM